MTGVRNAAQNRTYACLTPRAIKEELRSLVKETSVYSYLQMEPKDGYYDHKGFIDVVDKWYLDQADDDVQLAMGLVDESSYDELFGRYVNHVTHYVRKEKLVNQVTGVLRGPRLQADERGGEGAGHRGRPRGVPAEPDDQGGAWSIDNSGEKPDYPRIFPDHFDQTQGQLLREAQAA